MTGYQLAFGLPSYGEMMVLLVVGLLIFGRRLPEVGRQIGKTVIEFRRGLNSLRSEIRDDESVRDVRDSVRELKRDVEAPRVLADPRRLFDDLTDEALASPGPDADLLEAPAESLFEKEARDDGG